jgi:hypothetical protein
VQKTIKGVLPVGRGEKREREGGRWSGKNRVKNIFEYKRKNNVP